MINELDTFIQLTKELDKMDDKTFFNWYQDNFEEIQEENNEDLEIYLRHRMEIYFRSSNFIKN